MLCFRCEVGGPRESGEEGAGGWVFAILENLRVFVGPLSGLCAGLSNWKGGVSLNPSSPA